MPPGGPPGVLLGASWLLRRWSAIRKPFESLFLSVVEHLERWRWDVTLRRNSGKISKALKPE